MIQVLLWSENKVAFKLLLCGNKSGNGRIRADCRDKGIQKGTFQLAGFFRLFLLRQKDLKKIR